MTEAADGHRVKVHYTGKLDDGTVFDSSKGREPLEFAIGGGQVIQGFEEAARGMAEGDTKTVTFEPEDGYGPHREDMVFQVPREQIPSDLDPQVGMRVSAQGPGGQPLELTIAAVNDDSVTLDANHPLAGKRLTFEVEMVEVAG